MKAIGGHALAIYVLLTAALNVLLVGGYAVAWAVRTANNNEE